MTIDNETGLPELPEGYFWRVNRDSVEIRENLADTNWTTRTTYIFSAYGSENPRRETREVVREVTTLREVGFFRPRFIPEVRYKTEHEERYTNRSNGIVKAWTDKTEIEEHYPVTKKNILSLCERALETFEARNLLGDYPPKKLER